MINRDNPTFAANGGKKLRYKPWLENFTTGTEEIAAVTEVLKSGHLSLFEGSHQPDPPFSFYGGPWVQKLEKSWAEKYESPYAVAVNSATSGLYAAVGALGLGYGDEIIVSPYTMSACAMAPLVYGAIPRFADVDESSGCLDPASVAACIGPHTKAIIVVHQFGFPADMDAIMDLARQHDLKVIEDCAQAHGASYKGKKVGTFGDAGVFSLNVNKSLQTGEGGVVTAKDADVHYRLCLIRNHGEAVVGDAGYKDITNIVGFNYRMTEYGAALAIEQLKRLETLNHARLSMVDIFHRAVCEIPFIKVLEPNYDAESTYYIYPFRFLSDQAGISRSEFIQLMNSEGAAFYEAYVKPIYLQPMFQAKQAFKSGYPFTAPANESIKMNYEAGTCPVTERLHYDELIVNEHIRPPHTIDDTRDLVGILNKIGK